MIKKLYFHIRPIGKISLYISLSLAVVFFSAPTTKALTSADYPLQDIQFYSESSGLVDTSCTSAGTTVLTGNDNMAKIFNFLVSKGLSGPQAAGFMGNIMQESSAQLNPKIIQGGATAPDDYVPVNGVGFGLAQWTFTDRQAPLVALAKSKNLPVTDLSVQLDYIWQELSGDYKSNTLDPLLKTTAVDGEQGSTAIVLWGYEHPFTPSEGLTIENRASSSHWQKELSVRTSNAEGVLKLYGSSVASTPQSGTPSGGGSCTSSGSGLTNYTSANGLAGNDTRVVDGFVVFLQCDSAWGGPGSETCNTACGPFSMAMIVQNFGTKVDPHQFYEQALQKGWTTVSDGSTASLLVPGFAEQYHLRAVPIPVGNPAETKKALDSGALVIVSGKGSSPYTSGGHFIVIRKVLADGNFLIANPNSLSAQAATNTTEYSSTSNLFTEMHNTAYAVYKN